MPRAWRRADLRPVPLLNFVASHTTYFSGQMEQFLLGLRRPSVGPEVYEEDVEFQLIDILEVNTPVQGLPAHKDGQSCKRRFCPRTMFYSALRVKGRVSAL